jgi:hypothetical protein
MRALGSDLVRIGQDLDGGYVMLDYKLRDTIAYNFGISNEVSWDRDMLFLRNVIYQYDHTISDTPLHDTDVKYFKKGIASSEQEEMVTLSSAIFSNGHQDRNDLILNIDIEGYEYDVLRSIPPETFAQFSQIVIEYHWFSQALQDKKSLEDYIYAIQHISKTHQIIHVHGNNFSGFGVYSGIVVPDVIEATYVRKSDHSFVKNDDYFPTTLDRPNNPNEKDIPLGFIGFLYDFDGLNGLVRM